MNTLPLENDTLEVIVVDNASQNDEASVIEQRYPQVKVIRSSKNLGFAGGNNLGIQASHGKYLFFINNDTIIDDNAVSSDVSGKDTPDESSEDSPVSEEATQRAAEDSPAAQNDNADTEKTTVGSANENKDSAKTAASTKKGTTKGTTSTTKGTTKTTTDNTVATFPQYSSESYYSRGKCGDNITYSVYENGLLELNGSGKMTDSQAWWAEKEIIKKVTFTGNITSIGKEAFYLCQNLNSITIPSSVKTIGESAFLHCDQLKSITIPNNVSVIGNSAFDACWGLESITLPTSLTRINQNAFSNCVSIKSITIPNKVTEIGDYAFYYCSELNTITIPKSVTKIGNNAFGNCYEIADVNYKGSEEQWNSISISGGNTCLTNAAIHFNS